MGIVYREENYRIMGACFEVYTGKGAGFLEAVYQECLQLEFIDRDIDFAARPELSMAYKGRRLKCHYIPDFVCFEAIIVELKAVTALADEHRAQAHNYLHATGLRLALLVNFGHHSGVEYERIVL